MDNKSSKTKFIISGLIPLVLVLVLMAFIIGPGTSLLDFGIPLPKIHIENVIFDDSEIIVHVRNVGPIPIEVALVDVNDRIQPAAIEPDKFLTRFETGVILIPFEWNEAEPYTIGVTTSDGTRFEKEIDSASLALNISLELVVFFAVIGSLVGIIPIMIGLMWLPFIRRINTEKYHFFLALTAGLLLFLAIDAIEEAIMISDQNLADEFNGTTLVIMTVVLSFLGLYYITSTLDNKSLFKNLGKPFTIALMVSIGIGLHNFGEGLAIGSAIALGSLSFSTFLIVGFALHNTTEGIAIAGPLSRGKSIIKPLIILAMIAGSPAIFGIWVGGFTFNPITTVIFLAVGAGAIFQVIVIMIKWISVNFLSNYIIISGFAIGMLTMYVTSIII